MKNERDFWRQSYERDYQAARVNKALNQSVLDMPCHDFKGRAIASLLTKADHLSGWQNKFRERQFRSRSRTLWWNSLGVPF